MAPLPNPTGHLQVVLSKVTTEALTGVFLWNYFQSGTLRRPAEEDRSDKNVALLATVAEKLK
jgi:hypothetical protein